MPVALQAQSLSAVTRSLYFLLPQNHKWNTTDIWLYRKHKIRRTNLQLNVGGEGQKIWPELHGCEVLLLVLDQKVSNSNTRKNNAVIQPPPNVSTLLWWGDLCASWPYGLCRWELIPSRTGHKREARLRDKLVLQVLINKDAQPCTLTDQMTKDLAQKRKNEPAPDSWNMPSTTNLAEEEIVGAPGNDGNALMPE